MGSAIIDMGTQSGTITVTAQNGVKPYGLVYELLQAGIPVYWGINATKAHDGEDFADPLATPGWSYSYRNRTF